MQKQFKAIIVLLISILLMCVSVFADTQAYSLSSISGTTISTTPSAPKKCNVLIFGRPTCLNTRRTLKEISISDLIQDSRVGFIYADIDGNSKEAISDFAALFNQNIIFCYGDNSAVAWDLYGTYGSVALPFVFVIDSSGELVYTGTGYHTTEQVYDAYKSILNGSPAHTHTPVVTTNATPATCTATGNTEEIRCSVCGEIIKEKEYLPALGHTWSTWIRTKEPTAVEEGAETRYCERCGEEDFRPVAKISPSVSITPKGTIQLQIGQTFNGVKVTGLATGDSISSVESKNQRIAIVNERNGILTIKAIKKGSATISIQLKSGLIKSFMVKVTNNPVVTKAISVPKKIISLKVGAKYKIVYIYTSALKHKQYYKAMNMIRKGEKMLFFLKSSNTDESLRQFSRDLTMLE